MKITSEKREYMQKIRSGQSFLYRTKGYNSTVIEVQMKDKVRGDYLQVALTQSLKRYPYLQMKLVEKNGEFYLCENDIPFNLGLPTRKYRRLGSMSTGYNLIDVTFFSNVIRVAFHHAICDGGGIKPFVETLIYIYCCKKYRKNFDSTNIRTTDNIDPKEYEEPFGNDFYPLDKDKVFEVNVNPYHIEENTTDFEHTYRSEIKIKQDEFMATVKNLKATPSVLTSILFAKGIREISGPINESIKSNVAINLRGYFGKEKTHKNCTGSVVLAYSDSLLEEQMDKLVSNDREIMDKQRDENSIKACVNRQIGMFNKLDEIKSLEGRKKALDFFNSLSNDTFIISYLGKMQFNDFDQYVDSTRLYSEGSRGIIINIVASGDYFTFEILQNFENQKYVNQFIDQLNKVGLDVEYLEIGAFSTGQDRSYKTSSRQAERFYKIK